MHSLKMTDVLCIGELNVRSIGLLNDQSELNCQDELKNANVEQFVIRESNEWVLITSKV